MNRIPLSLIGPELYWIFLFSCLNILIKITESPNPNMNILWERMGYIVPFIFVPLCFAMYWLPIPIKPFLILRLIAASIVGSHFVLNKTFLTHTEQNSGTGTIYLMGMLFSTIVVAVLTVLILFKKLFVF